MLQLSAYDNSSSFDASNKLPDEFDRYVAHQGIAIAKFNYAFPFDRVDDIPIDKSLAAHYYKLVVD
jgi:hypothetical protein